MLVESRLSHCRTLLRGFSSAYHSLLGCQFQRNTKKVLPSSSFARYVWLSLHIDSFHNNISSFSTFENRNECAQANFKDFYCFCKLSCRIDYMYIIFASIILLFLTADCRQETRYYYVTEYTYTKTYYTTSCYLGMKRCRESK